MNLCFDEGLATQYKSAAQRIRVMSEHWAQEQLFCPCCGNSRIVKQKNNAPVADFCCEACGEFFELKSKSGSISRKIADGAYNTMIERITSATNPDLFVLRYSPRLEVLDLIVVPKFFFVPQVIERRKPLAASARRAGWVGCNILLCEIPQQGRIPLIANGHVADAAKVVERYRQVAAVQTASLEHRTWLFDVLNCVNRIDKAQFSLQEVYAFAEELQRKHPENHHVEAKIRQQLQVLRDRGFLEFAERGMYRKLL